MTQRIRGLETGGEVATSTFGDGASPPFGKIFANFCKVNSFEFPPARRRMETKDFFRIKK